MTEDGEEHNRFFPLQFLLIPIRDWNTVDHINHQEKALLQFLLIPIRDWNSIASGNALDAAWNCNFY